MIWIRLWSGVAVVYWLSILAVTLVVLRGTVTMNRQRPDHCGICTLNTRTRRRIRIDYSVREGNVMAYLERVCQAVGAYVIALSQERNYFHSTRPLD